MNGEQQRTADIVIGVDIGTTATKVVAATVEAEVLHQTERGYPLRTGEPGEATQDPETVRDAAVEALAECAAWAREQGHEVRALSFSTAMHTVLGLDAGFGTLEEECAEQGRDYEEVLDQRQEEVRMMKERGLPLPQWAAGAPAGAPGGKSATPEKPQAE